MGSRTGGKKPMLSGLAGSIAGICEISVTMPLDTIKTKMQLNNFHSGGFLATSQRVYRNGGGLPAFYAGYSAMVVQVSAKAGIRFFAYEQAKRSLNRSGFGLGGAQTDFISGIAAGVIEAGCWVTPTERIKVLQQAAVKAVASQQSNGKAHSLLQTKFKTGHAL